MIQALFAPKVGSPPVIRIIAFAYQYTDWGRFTLRFVKDLLVSLNSKSNLAKSGSSRLHLEFLPRGALRLTVDV
jgi:hypothetical protein